MSRPDVFYGASGYGDLADTNRFTLWGAGTPEAYIQADVGSMYMDTATGGVWTKTTGTGNTGWAQLASGTTGLTLVSATYTQSLVSSGNMPPDIAGASIVLPQAGYAYAIAASCTDSVPYGTSTNITSGSFDIGVSKNGAAYTAGPLVHVTSPQSFTILPASTYTYAAGDVFDAAAGTTALVVAGVSTYVVTVYVALT